MPLEDSERVLFARRRQALALMLKVSTMVSGSVSSCTWSGRLPLERLDSLARGVFLFLDLTAGGAGTSSPKPCSAAEGRGIFLGRARFLGAGTSSLSATEALTEVTMEVQRFLGEGVL